MSRQSALEWLLVAGAILSLLYLWVTPPWMGPDEPRHFEYVRLLVEKRKLVGWSDADPVVEQAIIASMARHDFARLGIVRPEVADGPLPQSFREIWGAPLAHELHQPPLAYLVYAAALAPIIEAPIERQLLVLRLVSVVIGLGSAAAAALALARLWPDDPLVGLGAAALVVLLPQRLWLSTIVSNDQLTILWGALLFLVLADGWRRGLRWWHLPAAFLLLALAILTKRTSVTLVGLLGAALLAAPLASPAGRRWVAAALVALLALGGALLWLGPTLWETLAARVPGLAGVGRTFVYTYIEHIVDPMPGYEYRFAPASWFGRAEWPFWGRFLRLSFESFWGRFGWLNVWLPAPLRLLLAAFTGVALLGLPVQLWRAARGRVVLDGAQCQALIAGAGALLAALAIVVQRVAQDWEAPQRASFQMRFLFPILPVLALALLWGLAAWVPPAHRRRALALLVGVLLLLNLYAIFFRLLPAWGAA